MNRILTFHYKGALGHETRIGPTYYIEADYSKVAVRVYAEEAPSVDTGIDIYDDGVSIFADTASGTWDNATGMAPGTPVTRIILGAGQNSDVYAADFNKNIIEQGSWVYCNLVGAGGGKNFSVHLELEGVSEDSEIEE